ncbi:bifunctional serine/threonine-protein kinase/glutamate ABC transporter substrate-binding protein [Saccharothrix deserti]|uniref:bifunctional serine/threonine-protein kinase/glutamate ABC transporter substrate-binding protein n=1 Tax=Saccharothrix deserti TaxID=2593674 RepID=UPI00131E117D|nr:bifunctional serine/threonine-protein kinase/glutamate ABC transporter substrate-binding protein [Saccharothrix deserti]
MLDPEGRLLAGRYRLRTRLGSGGMGTVWRATDEFLEREVAIKEMTLLDAVEESAPAFQRTLREARTSGRLRQPNIVTVHDVVLEDGRPWIVMELIEGPSLAEVVERDGPLPEDRAVDIARQLLVALAYIHERGVLHRDVKPANVLIDGTRVVLTDFGIAAVEGATALTATNQLIGSPQYIAPERINGAGAGAASDLWALGVTLYFAVTGATPFQRDDVQAVLAAVLTREPPPVPGALGPLIVGLLRKDPAARLTAADAVALLAPGRQPTRRMTPDPATQPPTLRTTRPTTQPGPQPTPRPTSQPVPQPASQSGPQSAPQPGSEPTAQLGPQSAPQPGAQPALQPGPRPTAQPAPQAGPEPAPRPAQQGMPARERRQVAVTLAVVLAVGVAAILWVAWPQWAGSSALERMDQRGTVTIGVRDDQPGLGWWDPVSQSFVGFDIEIAKLIAAGLGFGEDKITFARVGPAERENALATGAVDMVVGTYPITEESKQRVSFAGPYLTSAPSMLVRTGQTQVGGPASMRGHKVCTVTGTSSARELRNGSEVDHSDIVLMETWDDCVDALVDKRVDAVISDEPVLEGYASSTVIDTFDVYVYSTTSNEYGIGLAHDDKPTRDKVNDILNKALNDGTWREIYDRTLGGSGREPGIPTVKPY